ncbi:MAG TPA: hypothetical protein VHP33_02125, partial [Polyangiaceae bacterium]|nr:hypothetical protein [Polyangiaceae bacterium]
MTGACELGHRGDAARRGGPEQYGQDALWDVHPTDLCDRYQFASVVISRDALPRWPSGSVLL